MEELIVRPSTKFIKLGYAAVILLIIGAVIVQNQFKDQMSPQVPP